MCLHIRSQVGSTMIFLLVSCLIATSLAMPAELLANEPEARGLSETLQDAASSLAENVNGIREQVQEQITNIVPQQISENVIAPIQGIQQAITKPITENQDSYQITFAIPKPSTWLPYLSSSLPFQMPNIPSLSNWSSFLRPQGRVIPGLRSGYQGSEDPNYENENDENNPEENAGNEKLPEVLIIAFAIPKPAFNNPFAWPSFPFLNYNAYV